jgi:SAM-dependent methyltransferase
LADRIDCVNRRFETGLAIGAPGVLIEQTAPEKVSNWIEADWAAPMTRGLGLGVACEPERLPFADESFDLVASLMALHVVDDVARALAEIRRVLRPDGFFVAALFGGETLQELRAALVAAESDIIGGAAARIAPFATTYDMAGLVQQVGFAMPVADIDRMVVRYAEPLTLLSDLRGMGEACALVDRPPPLRRDVIAAAVAKMEAMREEDGRAPVTFEVITVTGWRAHPSQPKPLKPGSAAVSLASALASKQEEG